VLEGLGDDAGGRYWQTDGRITLEVGTVSGRLLFAETIRQIKSAQLGNGYGLDPETFNCAGACRCAGRRRRRREETFSSPAFIGLCRGDQNCIVACHDYNAEKYPEAKKAVDESGIHIVETVGGMASGKEANGLNTTV
jgi:hypothetical protein